MSVENISVKSMPLSAQGIYIYTYIYTYIYIKFFIVSPLQLWGFLTFVAECLFANTLLYKY